MSSETIEIYLNSKSASNYVNNTNNKLDYILNSVNYSITLINGYYNVNTLRTHLLDLLGVNWTIIYISKLNKYEFIHTLNNFTFLILQHVLNY